jgi:hypothetical protein
VLEINEHNEQKCAKHLELVTKKIKKQDEDLRECKHEISNLKSVVEKLSDIVLKVAPMEYCLAMREQVPKMLAISSIKRQLSSWDFEKRRWVRLTDWPVSSHVSDFAVVQDPNVAACIIGGTNLRLISEKTGILSGNKTKTIQQHSTSSEVWRYVLAGNRWERLPDLVTPRSESVGVVIKHHLLVFGGIRAETRQLVRSFEVLTLPRRGFVENANVGSCNNSSSWKKFSYPNSLILGYIVDACVFSDRVYCLSVPGPNLCARVYSFELETMEWTLLSTESCQNILQICSFEERLYILCTVTDSDNDIVRRVQFFNVKTGAFEILGAHSDQVLSSKFWSVRECGLPLEEKLQWICDIVTPSPDCKRIAMYL